MTPNFESLQASMEAADLEQFNVAKATGLDMGAAGIVETLKPIYDIVRPTLLLIIAWPFWPAKWGRALTIFVRVLDSIVA